MGTMMETINAMVEEFIGVCGLSGSSVPVVRHIALAAVAILLAWLSDAVCRRLLVPFILKLAARSDSKWLSVVFNRKVLVAACHIVPAIIIWQLLPLVFSQFRAVQVLLARLTAIYITIMSTRLIVNFIEAFKDLETDASSSTRQYLQSFCGVLKIVAYFCALIIVVAIAIGKNPSTLFAGLGATSAILMLVFKDTIEGLVAGIRLTSNDMVQKGDWITEKSAGVDGTVEEISLTTVKVRNFDNTIMTISPKTLVDGSFQNWKGMQEMPGRRVSRQLYFDVRKVALASDALKQRLVEHKFFTAQELEGEVVNMALFRTSVERYLESRPDVLQDQTLMVRQLPATEKGLPLEIYCFLEPKEWKAYEHHLADIVEHVLALATEFDLTIYQLFPNQ